MEDDKDLIVLIVGNNTEISNSSEFSEEHGVILNPETGEFSQAPVIKQKVYYSKTPAFEEKSNEFNNDLALKELSKTIYENEEFTERPEVKEVINEFEYDLALKELSGITEVDEYEDTINLTCFKEELYLPDSNDFFKTEIQIDKHDLGRDNKLKKNRHHKKMCQSKHDQVQEKKRGRQFMKPVSEHKSFVNELRCQFPELEQDEELLISTLANIMKDIKTPIPPANCYLMNGTKFKCSFCGQFSHTKWVANRHYQYVHGPRYLVCFACGTDFRSITTLYKHEKRCCNKDAVIVLKARAQIIGAKGRNRPFLDEEKRSEEILMERHRFICSECPAEFLTKISLEVHTRLHRGLRPFRCDICTAAYTSKAGLKRHMEKHSTEGYICDICQKAFKIKACLINHLNIHLPQKKYECIECGKRYAKKIDLNAHVSTKHLNQPYPHSCPVCTKGFSRLSALKYHMKHKHGMTIITRRALLCQLPTLSEEAVNKNELFVDAAVVVKNVDGSSKIVAPR